MSVRSYVAMTCAGAVALSSGLAFAHVSVSSPGFANQSQLLTFGIGHGCEGADTSKLEVTIPSGVSSVRVVPNVFGPVEIKKDDAGNVTKAVQHLCWDGCMFSNDVMLNPQTWNEVLQAMISVRDAHGWN